MEGQHRNTSSAVIKQVIGRDERPYRRRSTLGEDPSIEERELPVLRGSNLSVKDQAVVLSRPADAQ
jgi:hypothetical protein